MSFPADQRHGELHEIFPNVFFVSGAMRMKSPPLTFSRSMTVVREGKSLTIINSLRLNEAALTQLDGLGKVSNVIRLAAFHGSDDPFYKERYGAMVWALAGSGYGRGFDTKTREADSYFQPDVWMKPGDELPIANSKLFVYETADPKEGLVLLERDGGILVAGDSLQNWKADQYFSFPTKILMRMMGFFKPHNVGPGWYKAAKPNAAEVRAVLDLPFEHVLPAHGDPVVGDARRKYQPQVERLS